MEFMKAVANQKVVAMDFGTNDALATFGPEGIKTKKDLKLPRVKGGTTTAMDCVRMVEWFFNEGYDVIFESSTIGSSGVEPEEMKRLCEEYPERRIWMVTTRLVKNFKLDYPEEIKRAEEELNDGDGDGGGGADHVLSAWIIYKVATESGERVQPWTAKKSEEPKLKRINTSVRPHDKRGYRGPVPDMYMEMAPEYEELSEELQGLLGDGKGYLRARVLPLLMAFDEEGSQSWRGYVKIIGLYEHGYPSFYRRKTVDLMQDTAKKMDGVRKIAEVSKDTRKKAWIRVNDMVKEFYFLVRNGNGAEHD